MARSRSPEPRRPRRSSPGAARTGGSGGAGPGSHRSDSPASPRYERGARRADERGYRERDRERDSDRAGGRDRDRDRDRSDRDRERDRDRDRYDDRREKDRRSDRDRDGDSHRDRERYRDSEKNGRDDRRRDDDRDRVRERDRDRDYRDRDRDRSDRDRERERDARRDNRHRTDRHDSRDRDDRRDRPTDRTRGDGRSRDDSRDRDRRNGHSHANDYDSPRRTRHISESRDGDTRSPLPPGAASSAAAPPILNAPLRFGFDDPSAKPRASPGPALSTEEEKQRLKRERLEAWKKQRELEKLKEEGGKGKSTTPEPGVIDRKPDTSKLGHASPAPPAAAASPSRPTANPASASVKPPAALQMGAMKKIKLGSNIGGSHIKRNLAELEDEDEAPERKLVKMDDLPEIAQGVQSGDVVDEMVGDDLAAEEVHDVKPTIDEGMDIDPVAARIAVNARKDEMDIDPPARLTQQPKEDEDEEDELEAYMRSLNEEKRNVDSADAKRLGLSGVDADDSDDDVAVAGKDEDTLGKQEAMLAEAAAKTRKKDLPPPDHSKIDYEPFRKNFYTAPVEALDMTEEETELMRLEMDGIKIRGVDAPRPVQRWGALGIPVACLDVIQANGWEKPTSIQAQAIPAIMSGRDVIGIAKTGSGKTIAFLLPLFRHVKDQRPATGAEGPIAVVMGPTRELAMQIFREAKSFLKAMSLKVACCVGGSSISEDIATMKRGADIVVCTPGRMIDLLTANNGRVTNLRRCTYLVLDEADRMFDMGFEPQVMKIYNNIRPDAQKVLFSATFPKTMEGLARKILVKPLEITVGGRSVVAAEIDQRVEVRDQDTKFTRLLEILGEMSNDTPPEEDFRALIFVDRQEWADDLFRDLLQRGYVCASLHGGKEQVDREEAIKNFKTGDVPVIVATSVAARGLDVPQLRLVINYDAPNHMEDYVHRAGRTGRAGNKGTCITFITPDQDRYSVDILRALEASNAFVPKELKEMSDAFLAKIKDGRAKVVRSGFAGKGLERLEKRREEKDKAEKHTYGDTSEALSLSSREGAVIPYKPKDQTNQYKPPERDMKNESDYTFTEINVEIVHGPAPDRLFNPALFSSGKNAQAELPAQTLAAIEKAKAEGRFVDAQRLARVVAQLHKSIASDKTDASAAAMAELAKMKPKDPDATDYHAIFPINDYPQKARWKVTNKEQMTLLNEISQASVTMRGIYYPPGEDPKIGAEPKLHLLIESNDESKVRAAVEEIRRVLVEGSVQALNQADRGMGAGGRYAV